MPAKRLSGSDIRERFIRFFEARGHRHHPSASLVPTNPTVLLTPAGMLPFVPIFLGIEPPPSPPRAVSSQKCARVSGKASDLEYVGRTPRHHTFFEMLGNFSFGDYFKRDAITWAWEFVTQELQLPKERLWVSVFTTDMEARDIWRDTVGVPEDRILFRDEKDNFWGPPGPTGPCGPCSEIYYDYGSPDDPHPARHPEVLDTDRFVEIWNLVFMELFKDAEGNFSPLEKKNIDTGMGLERIAMVVQGVGNTFETDLLRPLVDEAGKLSGVPYGKAPETDVALKIIADHARFVVFAVADGIVPSNEGRGYVVRMILRRAVRYGRKHLGFQAPFLHRLVPVIRTHYQEAYPELAEKAGQVTETLRLEEERFLETLERGSRVLEEVLAETAAAGSKTLSGEDAFKLYDTYGFPLELTRDIALEEGFSLDEAGFETAMARQRTQARGARKGEALVEDQVFSRLLEEIGPSQFLGYDTLSAPATVKALLVDGEPVAEVRGTNTPFIAILDQTPFYAESGGQVGDRGTFSREEGPHGLTVVVNNTTKVGDLVLHHCLFDNGTVLKSGERLTAQVEPVYRQLAAIHHSATHLLHAALKTVLGDSISQAGSHVSPEGARFDFTFHRGLTPVELQQVEATINRWILENTPRQVDETDVETAKASGAVAMFGEKYGDRVRVVSYGEASRELCGGTHVLRLGEIGLVKLVSEAAIASGVRRIEMIAGEKAYKAFRQMESDLSKTAALLRIPVWEVPEKVERLLDEMKGRDKQVASLEARLAEGDIHRICQALPVDLPFHAELLEGQKADTLRLMAEKIRDRKPSHILLLAGNAEGKAAFVASVSDDWIKAGIQAGDLVKTAASLCQGGGGGKPQFAQAGGKDPSGIGEALTAVTRHVHERLARVPS